ncbi:Subtilisin-like proteinase Spm1 [Fusarium oxysporum f. sp. albedinis]|nr:Subtilisin-like proteinase Spm1 [Fusarium oxysporum f. sp. albedinis]
MTLETDVRPPTRPIVNNFPSLLGKVLCDRVLASCFVPPGLGVQMRLFAVWTLPRLPLLLQLSLQPLSVLSSYCTLGSAARSSVPYCNRLLATTSSQATSYQEQQSQWHHGQ